MAGELLETWASPLIGFLDQVSAVARGGNPLMRVGHLAEKAELAALCEAVLLMLPSGDRARSTRHSSLLGTRSGLVCLLNQDMVMKSAQVNGHLGVMKINNEGKLVCLEQLWLG